MDDKLISIITEEILRRLNKTELRENKELKSLEPAAFHFSDPEAMRRMQKKTIARIGVGRCGSRLNTATLLKLRADHAQARDAVLADVNSEVLERFGLFTVQTKCDTKNTFITRPDLGRLLSDEAADMIKNRCVMSPDVQIVAADGLSSTAIETNLPKLLPVLLKSLESKGLSVGTLFFVRYGRVACEDHVSELVRAKVVCMLIGERPGLATAESMSAYIAYNASVGMPESRRTVISNIHKDGTAAVEAGAYIADVIEKIIEKKTSGVDLVK